MERSPAAACSSQQLGYGPVPSPQFGDGLELAHPDDRAPQQEYFRAYLAGETPQLEFEVRLRHADGSYRTMLARGVAVRSGAGKPIRVIGTRVDITERRRIEDKLRQSESQLSEAQQLARVG